MDEHHGQLAVEREAARIGHCVGLVFDPEPYGDNPWAYPGEHRDRSFAEVEAQVHKRGAQFMTALQAELPNVRLLTFFHQSLFGDLLDNPDLQNRQQQLSQQHWGLLSAFWNGALEAAAPGARIIDGNELAYYMTNREQFFRAYHTIRQRSLSLVPEELRQARSERPSRYGVVRRPDARPAPAARAIPLPLPDAGGALAILRAQRLLRPDHQRRILGSS